MIPLWVGSDLHFHQLKINNNKIINFIGYQSPSLINVLLISQVGLLINKKFLVYKWNEIIDINSSSSTPFNFWEMGKTNDLFFMLLIYKILSFSLLRDVKDVIYLWCRIRNWKGNLYFTLNCNNVYNMRAFIYAPKETKIEIINTTMYTKQATAKLFIFLIWIFTIRL